MLRNLVVAVAMSAASVAMAQTKAKPKAKPSDFGLTPYTSLDKGGFPDGWAAIEPLSPDDVSEAHDNLDDLAWLTPIARASKVVLFGESHYYAVTNHLAHRVLFALQQG